MNTGKIFVYGFLAVIFALTFTACPTDDTPEETYGELQFTLINNGTAYRVDGSYHYFSAENQGYIEGYVGGEVIIPAYYNDLPVTSIGSFSDCIRLTGVIIPATITRIGSFSNCTGLTSITIPASVTSIGWTAFQGCTRLTNIIVADVNPHYSSENEILYNKDKTTIVAYPSASGDVTIPDSVTSIGGYAFSDCTSLTSITIPASVTSIGWYAFFRCTSLTSITIPAGVTSIDNAAFFRCTSLTSVTFAEGSQLTSIDIVAFSDTSLTSITIPDSVTSIGSGAFSGCTSLISINIPEGVTFIGNSAFSGCTSLISINIPEGVTFIGNSAFSGCTSLASINIPASVTSIWESAFSGCTKLLSVNIPAGVTSILERAFAGFNTTQLIIIQGKANQAAADAAWGAGWREDCNAIINYSE